MALFKQVWTFNGPSGIWSDVWYRAATNFQEASTIGADLIAQRVSLLHPVNRFKKVRVSTIAGIRQSVVIPINVRGTGNPTAAIPGANFPANEVESVTCNLGSAAFPSSRRWWLRGTPELAVFRQPDGTPLVNPAFQMALNGFFLKLEQRNYVILARERVGNAQVFINKLLSVDGTAANGLSVLTLDLNAGVDVGNMITIAQANPKDVPALNGNFKVLAVLGKTITVQYTTPGNRLIPTLTGYVKKLVYSETAVISAALCGFNSLGGRKTKNAVTGSRGARSAKRIRALA